MQALQLCLGVSARETGRGRSAATFVRTGATRADVEVELHNTGINAYQPEMWVIVKGCC
jgi:structural maintenance of chromosomes protein 6